MLNEDEQCCAKIRHSGPLRFAQAVKAGFSSLYAKAMPPFGVSHWGANSSAAIRRPPTFAPKGIGRHCACTGYRALTKSDNCGMI